MSTLRSQGYQLEIQASGVYFGVDEEGVEYERRCAESALKSWYLTNEALTPDLRLAFLELNEQWVETQSKLMNTFLEKHRQALDAARNLTDEFGDLLDAANLG